MAMTTTFTGIGIAAKQQGEATPRRKGRARMRLIIDAMLVYFSLE